MQSDHGKEPLLSICIPTYKRLKYLKELLSELVRQVDSIPDGMVEIVVSDNLSPDGTADYLKTIAAPYLRWWTNDVNIGGDRNFLKCIKMAHGEYVWLVGDDDLMNSGSIRKACDILVRNKPDLVIGNASADGECTVYSDYRTYLHEKCRTNHIAALSHSLITANIFRRSVFDLPFAESKLYTQYAHMFGLVRNLNGPVCIVPRLVSERPVRAAFDKFPACLCVKQAMYMWFLASRFSLPRFRLYAIKNACNLPVEYLSRLKNLVIGKKNAP